MPLSSVALVAQILGSTAVATSVIFAVIQLRNFERARREQAAIHIATTMETIGVLVYRRVVPLDIVDDIMGDATVAFWSKLKDWVMTLRRDQSRESVYEWFQWLVERLGQRERRQVLGAHMRYAKWQS